MLVLSLQFAVLVSKYKRVIVRIMTKHGIRSNKKAVRGSGEVRESNQRVVRQSGERK